MNKLQYCKSLIALKILVTLLVFPLVVAADELDTLNFLAGISTTSDSNLFRAAQAERSDLATRSYLGISLDKKYSLQRFKVDYTFSDNKYQNNSFLDYKAQSYSASWMWALTPYLTGSLSASSNQSLNDFRDLGAVLTQNIRTSVSQNFDVDFSPHNTWHLLTGLSRFEQTNSQVFNAQGDYLQNSIYAGTKYTFNSGSFLNFKQFVSKGEYVNRQLNTFFLYDNAFDEQESQANLFWYLSGHSKLDARLSYVNREHANFAKRNFSGEQGYLNYTWTPTGKLSITASASRQLASFQTTDSSYTQTDSFSLAAQYLISAKVSSSANISVSERNFLGQAIVASTGRVDKERSVGAAIGWRPYRFVTLNATARYSMRDSNVSNFDFNSTSFGLSADVNF